MTTCLADWASVESHHLVAAQLLDHDLLGDDLRESRLEKAAATVAPAFSRLDPLKRFLTAVKPSWVNGEAARRLVPLKEERDDGSAPDPAEPPVLILNASSDKIAYQYLARATFNALWGYMPIPAICDVGAGDDKGSAVELTDHFERVLRKKLHITDDRPAGQDLPHHAKTIYYLMVQTVGWALNTVAAAVRTIRQWHPWLVIVLLVGPAAPDQADLESAGLQEAIQLTPLLAPDAESRALQLVDSLNVIPKMLYGEGEP